MKRIDRQQCEWLTAWIRTGKGFLPSDYPRTIALLHPGTTETNDPEMPFRGSDAADENLSEEQAAILDQVLLGAFGPETQCNFGRYGGYLDASHQKELLEMGLTRVADRLIYYFGADKLSGCLFVQAAEDAFGFLAQSFLWADDRSWFISSEPDLAFTVIGCDDNLADRLLAEAKLGSRECSILPTAGLPR